MYRALDAIAPHRDALFSHLKTMYGAWFAPKFDIFLYDVASTFFEGQAMKNAKAARGDSRDSRPDCKQVCIGLVTSPEQLPLAFMIFAGNRPDIKTVEDGRDLMLRLQGFKAKKNPCNETAPSYDVPRMTRGKRASEDETRLARGAVSGFRRNCLIPTAKNFGCGPLAL